MKIESLQKELEKTKANHEQELKQIFKNVKFLQDYYEANTNTVLSNRRKMQTKDLDNHLK